MTSFGCFIGVPSMNIFDVRVSGKNKVSLRGMEFSKKTDLSAGKDREYKTRHSVSIY